MTIKNIFDKIKKVNEYGQEYWSARDLYKLLGYTEYNKFIPAINRAKESCKNAKQDIFLHFAQVSDPQKSRNQYREILGQILSDYNLSRYACYLIAQNGDPRKKEISLAQNYFVIQTRRQEIRDIKLEDGKRVYLRDEIKKHNKKLAEAAKDAGVINYANFQDYGYMGLYGGLRQRDIHSKKKLEKRQAILDHMGSEELAANLFRATQTEAKLKREETYGEISANKAHYDVGKKVRETIKDLGGTMPEKLPKAESIKESKKRLKE
jgi:DNA-damage-inducible protein D